MILEDGYGAFSKKRLELVEKRIGVSFPKVFITLIQDNDGVNYPSDHLPVQVTVTLK